MDADVLSVGAGPGGGATMDLVVIGAGVAGLYAVHQARERGLAVRGFEEGHSVGGTWYWNRYPGARLDSESYTYAYSFSQELLDEWDWSALYADQPELERYYNHVADKFDLRRHFTFGTRVQRLGFDERADTWEVGLSDGSTVRSRFVVAAVGPLSADYVPSIPGVDDFAGRWVHTGRWPAEGLDLAGQRVGIIGTGATGVQLIPELARQVRDLVVFQRTANYASPLRNRPLDAAAMREVRENYADIFQICRESSGGFMYEHDARSALEVSADERAKRYEELWQDSGFAKWLKGFREALLPGDINEEYGEFVRERIAERVADPEIAKLLVPTEHPFGAKRVPCETNYYETYERENVTLVDVRSAPIERITRTGVRTADAEYPIDVLIFATGYDAVTGPLDRILIEGRDGLRLKDKFASGVRTFLGIQSHGFPNLFTISAATTGNYTRAIEPLVEWIIGTIDHVSTSGAHRIEPTAEAEQGWFDYVARTGAATLRTQADTFFVGANIPGKARVLLYSPDTAPEMNDRRLRELAEGYPSFSIS